MSTENRKTQLHCLAHAHGMRKSPQQISSKRTYSKNDQAFRASEVSACNWSVPSRVCVFLTLVQNPFGFLSSVAATIFSAKFDGINVASRKYIKLQRHICVIVVNICQVLPLVAIEKNECRAKCQGIIFKIKRHFRMNSRRIFFATLDIENGRLMWSDIKCEIMHFAGLLDFERHWALLLGFRLNSSIHKEPTKRMHCVANWKGHFSNQNWFEVTWIRNRNESFGIGTRCKGLNRWGFHFNSLSWRMWRAMIT